MKITSLNICNNAKKQPNFKAKPIANYTVKVINETPDGKQLSDEKMTVYKLEPNKDEDFLRYFLEAAEKKKLIYEDHLAKDEGNGERETHSTAWYTTALGGIKLALNSLLLQSKYMLPGLEDTISYLAVVDNKPCGLISGHIPSISMEKGRVLYGDNSKETRLWGFFSWSPFKEKTSGVGSALITETFNHFIKNLQPKGFKDIILTSSAGSESKHVDAKGFYYELGFVQKGDKELIPNRIATGPRPLPELLNPEGLKLNKRKFVHPMTITSEKVQKAFIRKSEKYDRQELVNQESVDLMETLDLSQIERTT